VSPPTGYQDLIRYTAALTLLQNLISASTCATTRKTIAPSPNRRRDSRYGNARVLRSFATFSRSPLSLSLFLFLSLSFFLSIKWRSLRREFASLARHISQSHESIVGPYNCAVLYPHIHMHIHTRVYSSLLFSFSLSPTPSFSLSLSLSLSLYLFLF